MFLKAGKKKTWKFSVCFIFTLQDICVYSGYFWRTADPSWDKSWTGKSARALSQLPYHLVSNFNMLAATVKFSFMKVQFYHAHLGDFFFQHYMDFPIKAESNIESKFQAMLLKEKDYWWQWCCLCKKFNIVIAKRRMHVFLELKEVWFCFGFQSCGGCFKELSEVLCSLRYIHAKCSLGLAAQLMEDFAVRGCSTKAMEKEQTKYLSTNIVKEYHEFVSNNLQVLAT